MHILGYPKTYYLNNNGFASGRNIPVFLNPDECHEPSHFIRCIRIAMIGVTPNVWILNRIHGGYSLRAICSIVKQLLLVQKSVRALFHDSAKFSFQAKRLIVIIIFYYYYKSPLQRYYNQP